MIRSVLDLFRTRRQAYAATFERPEAREVLDDLVKFCRLGESVYHKDQRMTDVMIGRQEVLHRILDYANLDVEALYGKYAKDRYSVRLKPGEDENG